MRWMKLMRRRMSCEERIWGENVWQVTMQVAINHCLFVFFFSYFYNFHPFQSQHNTTQLRDDSHCPFSFSLFECVQITADTATPSFAWALHCVRIFLSGHSNSIFIARILLHPVVVKRTSNCLANTSSQLHKVQLRPLNLYEQNTIELN